MVYLGSDHAGFALKEKIKSFLKSKGLPYSDLGPESLDPNDDYPIYAEKVARSIESGEDKGILICRGGHGVSVAANKVKGIRASVAFSPENASAGRRDDNLNILCLASDYLTPEESLAIVEVFLSTPFSKEERHLRRLGQIKALEG